MSRQSLKPHGSFPPAAPITGTKSLFINNRCELPASLRAEGEAIQPRNISVLPKFRVVLC
jgi:hypothetical protein